MTEAEFVDYLALKINEWITGHFAGWIPAPHMDDFRKWANQFRAGGIDEDKFYGRVCQLENNGEVKE